MIPAQIAVPTYAALLPPGVWAQIADPFTYVAEFLPLNALQNLNFDNNIQNDSDFLLVQAVAQITSTDDQTLVAFLPALVNLLDQGAGRTLMSRPSHFHNLFATGAGGAGLVHYFPVPKLIDRGSTFTTQIRSLFAATNVNVRIDYQGLKLFGPRGAAQQIQPADLVRLAQAILAQVGAAPGAPK